MHQDELEFLSRLIASIYEMAVDPSQWSSLDALTPAALTSRIAPGRAAPAIPIALVEPHLERARQLSAHLARQRLNQLLQETTLDAISVGAVITDASARVLYTTRVADQLLHGGGLVLREGRLEAATQKSAQKLRQQIELTALPAQCEAVTPAHKYLSIRAADGTALQLYITVVPVPIRTLVFGDACALIYCHDARMSRRPLAESLQHLFHLTKAESQVAEALLHGRPLKSYAEQRQISIHTVKNQLRSVFEKTRHTSQVDFVQGMLTNPLVAVASQFSAASVFMAETWPDGDLAKI